jgi:hypothetical protein
MTVTGAVASAPTDDRAGCGKLASGLARRFLGAWFEQRDGGSWRREVRRREREVPVKRAELTLTRREADAPRRGEAGVEQDAGSAERERRVPLRG